MRKNGSELAVNGLPDLIGEDLFGRAVRFDRKEKSFGDRVLADVANDIIDPRLSWANGQHASCCSGIDVDPVVSPLVAAEKGGGTCASLITAIVTSDLVMMTRTETK